MKVKKQFSNKYLFTFNVKEHGYFNKSPLEIFPRKHTTYEKLDCTKNI